MPRPPRFLLNGETYLITSSIEEGLPLACNPLIKTIIESCLARAQSLYPVRLGHHLFEANHLHMLVTVDNPQDLVDFMRHFKTETAHAINNLLGRDKKTVWCESFDSPALLTVEDVIRKIAYLYSNPAKDNLEDSVDCFPGLSSWQEFRSKRSYYSKKCPWINRSAIHELPRTKLSIADIQDLTRRYKNGARKSHTLRVDLDGWFDSFGITDPKERRRINERIIELVRDEEARFRRAREQEQKTVLGAQRLALRPIDTPYNPKRRGRRSVCISEDKSLRKDRVVLVRSLKEKGDAVYQRWKIGDTGMKYPLGLFPPSMPKLGESIFSKE